MSLLRHSLAVKRHEGASRAWETAKKERVIWDRISGPCKILSKYPRDTYQVTYGSCNQENQRRANSYAHFLKHRHISTPSCFEVNA